MADKAQDEPLIKPVKNNDIEAVRALLKSGASADGIDRSGLPLIWASYLGHLEIVDILLSAGACKSLKNTGKTALDWAREGGHMDVVVRLEASPDQIIYQRPLSDRTLEEVFNFVTLERISLLRRSPRGQVEAMTREPFSAIADQSQLRKAFDEHRARGGKVDEAAVFPNTLSKPRQRPNL